MRQKFEKYEKNVKIKICCASQTLYKLQKRVGKIRKTFKNGEKMKKKNKNFEKLALKKGPQTIWRTNNGKSKSGEKVERNAKVWRYS